MKQQKSSSLLGSTSTALTGTLLAINRNSLATFSVTLLLFAVLIGAFLWFFVVRRFVRSRGRLPPGPIGLPFFGATPFLGKNPQLQVTAWAEKYRTNVYSLYLGPKLCIILNDYYAIKSAYIDQADIFTGRPQNFVAKYMARGINGILITEGAFWREQRRFLMRSFHELGVGKSRFEQLCIEEAQCLIDAMVTHNGSAFNPRHEIDTSVANIICALVFGKRFERKDPKLREFLDNQYILAGFLGPANTIQVLPFLRHVPPVRRRWREFETVVSYMRGIIESELKRVESEYVDPQQEPQCVAEFFIQRRAKEFGGSTPEAEKDDFVNFLNIITNIQVMFGAGTETSVTTLTWSILFLLHYPAMQQRCYAEILERVGTDRPVTWDDRSMLPYTEAFMHEVLRRANVVPLGVARCTTEDTYLNGYFIPKRTMVIPNLWQVHRDERNWREPLKFEPERFLTHATGDSRSVQDKMSRTLMNMPFSTGKRQCAGEGIARMEIFLFLANLIQKLEFLKDANGEEIPDIDDIKTGVTVQPAKKFHVIVRERNKNIKNS